MFAVGVGVTSQPAAGCPHRFIVVDVLIFISRLLSSDVDYSMVPTRMILLDNLYFNSCFLTRFTVKKSDSTICPPTCSTMEVERANMDVAGVEKLASWLYSIR